MRIYEDISIPESYGRGFVEQDERACRAAELKKQPSEHKPLLLPEGRKRGSDAFSGNFKTGTVFPISVHILLFFVLLGDPQASRSFACRVGAPRGVLFSMLLVLPRGIFHFFGFASRMPWFKIIHSVRARVHGSLNILHLKGCFLLATWQSFRTSSNFGIFSEHCCR